LMDISMPDLNGMEATRKILAFNPNIRILALSMHTEKIYVKGMLNAGASGYVLKSCSFKELMTAIRTVLAGHMYVSPEITHLLLNDSPDRLNRLSEREKQVLVSIAEGHSSREIADMLHLSVKTIDIYRRNLKAKLGIQSVAGLTRYAIAKGLIPPVP
ncbi:MAG: response regulator transcription factor, partial [Desulfotignum sp.]